MVESLVGNGVATRNLTGRAPHQGLMSAADYPTSQAPLFAAPTRGNPQERGFPRPPFQI